MEGAQKKNLKFDRTLNGCVICFDTIPLEYIKKAVRIREGQSKSRRQDSRFSFTHTLEKDAGDNAVEPDKEHLSAKVIDKDTLSEEALCATQVLHTSGNSLHHHKKIGNTRHRCFVVLSGRNQTASDDQALDRVMTAPKFGRGANGSLFRSLYECQKANPRIRAKSRHEVAKLKSETGS